MDDLGARSLFLFGSETIPEDIDDVYPDPTADLELSDLDLPSPTWQLLRRAVVTQVLDDTPPETWTTAQRLMAEGLDRHEALDQLARGLFYGIAEEFARREAGETTTEIMVRLPRLFDRLPLPDEQDVIRALRDVVSAEQGIVADALVRRAAAVLDRDDDDDLASRQVRMVLNRLARHGDVLGPLSGGRLVDRPALAASVVLTHRITAAELATGELRLVLGDLCLFADAAAPMLISGEALEHVDSGGGPAWSGPPGWLDQYAAGDVVAVRCRVGDDEQVLSFEPAHAAHVDERLVEALRRAFDDEIDPDGAAVPIAAVVARVAVDDPEAFSTPQAPVTELAAAAGVEVRGTYAGTEPHHWVSRREEERHERLHERCDDDDLVHDAGDVLADLDDEDADADDLRAVLRRLRSDDAIAELVIDEVAPSDGDDDASGPVARAALASRLLDVARRADEVAIARWLAGVIAERDGDLVGAEAHFQAGHVADAVFEPLIDRCAWYASDRGDARTASRLWRSLSEPPADELETVARFSARGHRALGRNEPCWCGSGRKFKVCHQRQQELPPLPDRVGWLCRKATSYLMRRMGEAKLAVVGNVVALAGGDEEAMFTTAVRDPLVVDAALHEGGWFERFVAERGQLLPDDEQLLAARWLLVERTVYEVVRVDPGRSVDMRDLRSGDEVTVSERSTSAYARAGTLWCARAVPDGAGHQILGGVFAVAAGQEREVLDLCDRRDPLELCGYVASTRGQQVLTTREGEPMVECEAALHVDDAVAAAAALDELYEREEHGWVELFELNDDESIVRATLTLTGNRLSVLTHSTERMDRALAALRSTVPTIELVSDERQPVEPGELPKRMPGTGPATGLGTSTPLTRAQREEFVAAMEQRWLRESVPALDGRTPIDAVADPIGREQVARLIDSLPEVDGPLMTMRPARLRTALGL